MNPAIIIGIVVGAIITIVISVFVVKSLKGKLTLQLSRGAFSSGEAVTGTLDVLVKKSLQVNRLFVALGCYEEVKYRERDNDGKMQTRTRRDEVFRNETDLDGGGEEFPAGYQNTYEFEVPVPGVEHLPRQSSSGSRGLYVEVGSISVGGGRQSSRLFWKVEARLDTPGLDLTTSRRVQINLS